MSALNKVVLNDNKTTPQTEQAESNQVQNNAGGFTFKITDEDRFNRFLTIGSDGGTYYQTEQKLTMDNVEFVQNYVNSNGVKAVDTIVEISQAGRAPKNDQAIFALALAFNSSDLDTKAAAKQALPKVCRTATHLFMFVGFIKNVSGFGRAKTKAISNWYEEKDSQTLAFQLVKYRNRHGFTHRDVLRLCHAANVNENLVNFALGKDYNVDEVPEIVKTFNAMQAAKTEAEIVDLIKTSKSATWEFVPTEFHKSVKVWEALFYNGMPQMALLRNIVRFAKLDMFNDMKFAADVAKQLSDSERIKRGRIHPINYLNALVTFNEGQYANRSAYAFYSPRNKDWRANAKISAALDKGYELAFGNIEPANKRTFVALDVSGSMDTPASGLNMSCAQVSGALASFIARTEPYSEIRGFSAGPYERRSNWSGGRHDLLIDLGVGDTDSFNDVMKKISNLTFGRTDCALPMRYAHDNNIEVDTFIVVTDNETYAGNGHPHEWLKKYNKKMNRQAKLVVVAATATEFSIAESGNPLMLDVSGFDSATPRIIADFSAGRI